MTQFVHYPNLDSSLGNKVWLLKNLDSIISLLPISETHISNIDNISLGYALKLLGVEWHSEEELASCLAYFEQIGILRRNGSVVKANSLQCERIKNQLQYVIDFDGNNHIFYHLSSLPILKWFYCKYKVSSINRNYKTLQRSISMP